jgi:hypothetical protein
MSKLARDFKDTFSRPQPAGRFAVCHGGGRGGKEESSPTMALSAACWQSLDGGRYARVLPRQGLACGSAKDARDRNARGNSPEALVRSSLH